MLYEAPTAYGRPHVTGGVMRLKQKWLSSCRRYDLLSLKRPSSKLVTFSSSYVWMSHWLKHTHSLPFSFKIKSNICVFTGCLRGLECCLVHLMHCGFNSRSEHIVGCGFDFWSGRVREAINQCFSSLTPMSVSFSLSLSLPLSLKSINISLGEYLKKKE